MAAAGSPHHRARPTVAHTGTERQTHNTSKSGCGEALAKPNGSSSAVLVIPHKDHCIPAERCLREHDSSGRANSAVSRGRWRRDVLLPAAAGAVPCPLAGAGASSPRGLKPGRGSRPERGSARDTLPFGIHLTETRALLLLNIIALLYGTNTTMMKTILESTHNRASAATAARSVSAALAVTPMLVGTPISLQMWKASFEVGGWFALACLCQSMHLMTATSSEASVMLALTLVVVSVLEIICGRQVTLRRGLPVLFAIAGLVLLERGKYTSSSGDEAAAAAERASLWTATTAYVSNGGTFWGLGSAVGFGVHLFRSDAVQEYVTDAVKLGGLQLVTCAVFHIIWLTWDVIAVHAHGDEFPIAFNELPWIDIVFCGVVTTGLCQFMELVCVKYAKASSTAIVFAQVPVWGMVLGYFVHQDRMSGLGLLGSAMVICAAAVPHLLTALGSPAVPPAKLKHRISDEVDLMAMVLKQPFLGDVHLRRLSDDFIAKPADDQHIRSPCRRTPTIEDGGPVHD